MDKHWNKLRRISNLSDDNLRESRRIIYNNITFVDEVMIPQYYRTIAYDLVKDIDINDIVFVALNEYQNAILWSGDKALVHGLRSMGYDKILRTDEIIKLRDRLEKY
jgi:predicted nucleic acid-binding protein